MGKSHSEKPPWGSSKMMAVDVMGISVCPPYQGYVVILQETGGDLRLPIFIGVAEAQAISILLQGMEYARPLTFELFGNILNELTVKIESIRVTQLKENTFYAVIELTDKDGIVHYVDARPSDSIALALKMKAPIYVAERVMENAAIHPDQLPDADMDQLEGLKKQLQKAVSDENYEEAARLRDKIKEVERRMGVKRNPDD